jgi:hypothetical protein
MYNTSPWQAVNAPISNAMSSFYGSTPVKAATGFSKGVLSAFNPYPNVKGAYDIVNEKGFGAAKDLDFYTNIGSAALQVVPYGKALKAAKLGLPAMGNAFSKSYLGKVGTSFLGGSGAIGAYNELQQDEPPVQPVDTSMFGQFLGQRGGRGYDTVQNKFTLDLDRTNQLTGKGFTTRVEGDRYVLVERPNPLRPNEKTRTYVKESEYKASPTGSVVGTGYSVPRTNPLTGKLENTIVDEAGAKTLTGNMGAQPSIDLSSIGRGAYNAAMGAANSEYNIGKKAAQRDLMTMLQQLSQTATGAGLDTSMAAAQAGMDTSPGALDVSLDSIEGARGQGEAGARGDFAKTLGQLQQRRLRQQAGAANAASQAQNNAVLSLYLAQMGML